MYDEGFRNSTFETVQKENSLQAHRFHFEMLVAFETKKSFPITHRQRKGLVEDGLNEWTLFCLTNYLHRVVCSNDQEELDKALLLAEKTRSRWSGVTNGSILELRPGLAVPSYIFLSSSPSNFFL